MCAAYFDLNNYLGYENTTYVLRVSNAAGFEQFGLYLIGISTGAIWRNLAPARAGAIYRGCVSEFGGLLVARPW